MKVDLKGKGWEVKRDDECWDMGPAFIVTLDGDFFALSDNEIHAEMIKNRFSKKCLHEQCAECNGTGTKKDNTPCLHIISCPCSKCSPYKS